MRRFDVADSIKKAICGFEALVNTSENEISIDSSSDSESSPKPAQSTVPKRNSSSSFSYGKRKRKKSAKAKLSFTKIELDNSKTIQNEKVKRASIDRDFKVLEVSSENVKTNDTKNISVDKYSEQYQAEDRTSLNVSPILMIRHISKINHKNPEVHVAEENIQMQSTSNFDKEFQIDPSTVENKLDHSPVLKSNYVKKKKTNVEPKIEKIKIVQNKKFKNLVRIISDDICISSCDSQVSPTKKISQESYISSLQMTPEENCASLNNGRCESAEIDTSNTKITFNNHKKTNIVESVSKKKKKFPITSDAGRLQKILRKQDSMISIWKHEKYMASRGNFECPAVSEKCLTLKINSCREECGMFLIDCEDCLENTKYIAIINSYFVKELTVCCNWTLTIYKPYKIIQIDNTPDVNNVIVNVCKFDVTKV